MTRRARLTVFIKSAVWPRLMNSAREGSSATAMAVPMIVSGTCWMVQPRFNAPTPVVPKWEARLSRATKYAWMQAMVRTRGQSRINTRCTPALFRPSTGLQRNW